MWVTIVHLLSPCLTCLLNSSCPPKVDSRQRLKIFITSTILFFQRILASLFSQNLHPRLPAWVTKSRSMGFVFALRTTCEWMDIVEHAQWIPRQWISAWDGRLVSATLDSKESLTQKMPLVIVSCLDSSELLVEWWQFPCSMSSKHLQQRDWQHLSPMSLIGHHLHPHRSNIVYLWCFILWERWRVLHQVSWQHHHSHCAS